MTWTLGRSDKEEEEEEEEEMEIEEASPGLFDLQVKEGTNHKIGLTDVKEEEIRFIKKKGAENNHTERSYFYSRR